MFFFVSSEECLFNSNHSPASVACVQVLGIIKIQPVFSLTLLQKKELIKEVLCLG